MTDNENSSNRVIPTQNNNMRTRAGGVLGRLTQRRTIVIVCSVILGIISFTALFAEIISPHNPLIQDISNRLRPPGWESIFGTDNFGRDVFSRVIHGSRSSLYIAVTSVITGTVLGTLIGTLSAYRGGWIDILLQRVIDTFLGFPSLVLAVILIVTLGTNTNAIAIAIAVALTPQVARISRSHVLSIKEENYVLISEAIGSSPSRTVMKHILPHTMGPIFSYAMSYIGIALIAESALSFLGLGVAPPYPSWGGMLQEGRLYQEVAPWLTLIPGLILTITVASFALLGDALRDMFDPRGFRNPLSTNDSKTALIRTLNEKTSG
jgi:peptide/nickel transport system permease protein